MSLVLKNHPYEDNPHIALLQLNRPEVLNALSTDLMEELVDKLFECDDDPDIRVIILTGNSKAFAAGADIAQMLKATPVDQILEPRFRSWQKLRMIKKPIIAAVDGFALGGGCELAMSCDIIIATEKAQFGQPEIKIGTTPGAGGTQRLTSFMGKSKSMLHILTGDFISSKEAERCGLVARVVPDQTLLYEANAIAVKISQQSPIAVRLAKDSINKYFEMPLSTGVEYERNNFYLTFATADQKEGMTAFVEKRPPQYQGN
jgi:enoyl-CoA hydratase